MEMIERYLQAVRFWLPNRQKDDIIAELSAEWDPLESTCRHASLSIL